MSYFFLTKALIFKPRKLPDGYFWVPDARNIIKNAKNERSRSNTVIKSNSSYAQFDNAFLTRRAEQLLYEIQCSSNNYIDITIGLVAFFCFGLFLKLIPEMWNYHREGDVKLFLIIVVVSAISYFLYSKKKEMDYLMVNDFIIIESVLQQRL